MKKKRARVGWIGVLTLVAAWGLGAARTATAPVTTPRGQFGFNLGDDYHLANFRQLTEYWRKLDQESDRVKVVEIGKTAEGRTMLMAIVTSPENQANLERYRQISRRLALAENLSQEQAEALAEEGKAVVWIDGGLHATEVLGAQQLMELVYQMASRDDSETLRILKDVILLAVCVNPDGMDLVADWYNREPDPEKRSTSGLPRLYQKYIGHDNNRDFYMVTQPETEAINRVLYIDWCPQIVYNHHQTGPAGTVLFAPPFRDPFNYVLDPLIPISIDLVGAAMHTRFLAEDKPGATLRSGAPYSTWWNGGLRTEAYFHNMIGLLTETIGNPTPIEIPFIPSRQLPRGDLPYPVPPQTWHFRQSVDYSITANRAVLDLASRERGNFLMNIYRMGRNSIERGSRDHWTIDPERVAAVEKAAAEEPNESDSRFGRGIPVKYYEEVFHDPKARDPRGYILPSDQPDFLTAGKFVNTLLKNGVTVLRATDQFVVGDKSYPSGSFVVKTAQAFRPHILDMFEPQRHPNDFEYPGGPPKPPYDSAGWTLAFQMGVQFDRVADGFDGPFEPMEGLFEPAAGHVTGPADPAGYALSHRVNDSFAAVNRLLAAGEKVYWVKQAFEAGGTSYPAGTIYVARGEKTPELVGRIATETGLDFDGLETPPGGAAWRLRPVRVGLWDRYGGSIPSGWTRWLFERFDFPYTVVYPPDLDAGNLADQFDVLLFVDGAMPGLHQRQGRGRRGQVDPDSIPEEYRNRLGDITTETTIPQLGEFVRSGGTILAVGDSTVIAAHLGLPVTDALVERQPNGSESHLSSEKFYIPGSLLRARIDTSHPLAYGMDPRADVYFDNSPAFRIEPSPRASQARSVAWFANERPLRSGWAWGQGYLKGTSAVVEVRSGKGRVVLYGPEVTFRAQPHGTFKLLFNGIQYATAEAVELH